jgi:hypothetical protein
MIDLKTPGTNKEAFMWHAVPGLKSQVALSR